jgi:LysR family glycine cleavage system transcriptional activator
MLNVTCTNHIDIRIGSSVQLINLSREGFDCGIRYGAGPWPGLNAEFLMRGRVSALVHRSWVERLGLPKCPADLARYSPLYSMSAPNDWAQWMTAAGVKGEPPIAAQTYDSRELVMQAILQGSGVGIVECNVLGAELERGELIQLFNVEILTQGSYYLVSPNDTRPTQSLIEFSKWIINECARV